MADGRWDEEHPLRPSPAVRSDVPSGGSWRGFYVVAILTLVFATQYLDRQLLSLLAEPIRLEFGLADDQLGLLTGIIFSVSYSVMLLPVGYLVDRVSRRNLLAVALAIWSGATLLSAFARNLPQLALARMLVAGAESTNNPASLSIIADLFDRRCRSFPMGIFFCGPALVTFTMFPIVGLVAQHHGWRAAFLLGGVPGLLLCLLLLVTVREPSREGTVRQDGPAPQPREAFAFMARQKGLLLLIAGMTMTTFMQSSNIAWMAPYLMRNYHLPLAETLTLISLAFGLPTALGQIFGGRIVDRIALPDVRRLGWCCALFCGIALVFALMMVATLSLPLTLVSIGIWSCAVGLLYGPTAGAMQTLVLPRMRGAMTACYALGVNLLGAGCGPWMVGALSTHFSDKGNDVSLRIALALVALFELAAVFCFVRAARRLPEDMQRTLDAAAASTAGD